MCFGRDGEFVEGGLQGGSRDGCGGHLEGLNVEDWVAEVG